MRKVYRVRRKNDAFLNFSAEKVDSNVRDL